MPLATMSGLTRPSRVGPRELKLPMPPLKSTAPTATVFLPLAVKLTEVNGPLFGWCTVSQCASPVEAERPVLQRGVGQSVPLPFVE